MSVYRVKSAADLPTGVSIARVDGNGKIGPFKPNPTLPAPNMAYHGITDLDRIVAHAEALGMFKPKLEFTLPYPPSVNTYWRSVVIKGRLRVLLSAKARTYRKDVCAVVGPVKTLEGRLRVVIELSPPDKRRRDLDNVVKALGDSLQHAGVYRDDEQIDFFSVQRMTIQKGGSCRVVITEI